MTKELPESPPQINIVRKIWREVKRPFRRLWNRPHRFHFSSSQKRYDAIQKMSLKNKQELLSYEFHKALGYALNWENPKSFNEKLQWLKLYYRDPLITKCSDKYLVREYIKERVGEEYLVPLLGVWKNENEIDFNTLPEKFVLKVNWGSGQNIICQNKASFDIQDAKKKLHEWLLPSSNCYYFGLEWGYKDIDPMIICEKYIEQIDGSLLDYKFICTHGKPDFSYVVATNSNDRSKTQLSYYDIDWILLPVTREYKCIDGIIEKPKFYGKMLDICRKLSEPFPHVRIDFYELDHNLYVGELTFYSGSGFCAFNPIEWDFKFGSNLELPRNFNGDKKR